MKKSLFAVAALGAFAGAAQAQSSVTVYGIIDAGYIGSNQAIATNTIPSGQTNTSGVTKSTAGGIGSGAQSTNRLGFRGTEDLGGGTTAFFTYEVALGINDSNSLGANGSPLNFNGTGVANQNRQAFVGIAQKGLGRLSMGTQYTPIHTNVGLTSANGQNNIMGDMIYTAGTTQSYSVTAGASNAPSAQPSTALASSSNAGYTIRAANMIMLQSENMGGVTAQAFAVINGLNNTQGTTSSTQERGGKNDRMGYGGALNFSAGKFLGTANYQAFRAVNPYGSGDLTCSGVSGGTSSSTGCTATYGATSPFVTSAQSGVNVYDTQYYIGATYDFGFIKAYAQYINRKWISAIDSGVYGQRNAQQIGIKGNLTPKIEYWASGGSGTYRALASSSTTGLPVAGATNQNIFGYQVGSNYWLSKRTNLYAIMGGYNVSTSNSTVTNYANGAYNGNNYAVGLRHTF